jgi:S1 RNA binding domain
MPDSNNKKKRASTAAISGDALDYFKFQAGFLNDRELAKALPPPRMTVRTIERARAGKRITLPNIHLLAKKLGIKPVFLKPTFGGEYDAKAFEKYDSHDNHIDRPAGDFDKLRNIATLASEVQRKAELLQQLVVEAVKRASSVVITFRVSKEDGSRLKRSFMRGSLDDLKITAMRINKQQWLMRREHLRLENPSTLDKAHFFPPRDLSYSSTFLLDAKKLRASCAERMGSFKDSQADTKHLIRALRMAEAGVSVPASTIQWISQFFDVAMSTFVIMPIAPIKPRSVRLRDLRAGMRLTGTVMWMTDFGIFVDIGLQETALLHLTEMPYPDPESPYDMFTLGEQITVWVLRTRGSRVALTMAGPFGRLASSPSEYLKNLPMNA